MCDAGEVGPGPAGLERDVDDDDGDLLFSGHAYVDSDKTSTQAHNFYILLIP